MVHERPKVCGCEEGRANPLKCRSYGAYNRTNQNYQNDQGVDWVLLLATGVAAGVIFTLIPSWEAGVAMIAVSGFVNLFTSDSALTTVAGPFHLAASVYVLSYCFRRFAGMTVAGSRAAAIVSLVLLSASVMYAARQAREMGEMGDRR
jgi:hypothetical protein